MKKKLQMNRVVELDDWSEIPRGILTSIVRGTEQEGMIDLERPYFFMSGERFSNTIYIETSRDSKEERLRRIANRYNANIRVKYFRNV